METVTKKITWILKDASEKKLKTYGYHKPITSGYFTVVFGDRIYDKWYLDTFTKDESIIFYLNYHTTNLDDDLNVSIKYFCGQLLMSSSNKKGKNFRAYGRGFSNIMAFHEVMTHVDKNKNLSFDVEITLTKAKADNKVKVTPQSNVVRENYAEFIENEFLSDVSLMCCDGVQVSAHRLLLVKKSAEFKSIFDNTQHMEVHRFEEIDSMTMKEILKYIYSGNSTLVDIHLIKKIYKAAVELDLAELQLQCVDALTNLMNSKNVLEILEIANSYNLEQLEEKALLCLTKYFHVLISTPKWSQMSAGLKDKVSMAIYGHLPSIVLENIL